MKDTTLITVAPLIGMNMWLESTNAQRTNSGSYAYSATVKGEAYVYSFDKKETRQSTGTAQAETPQGAMILAYANCMRNYFKTEPFPDALARDLERLENE